MVIKLDRLSDLKDLGSLFDLYIKGRFFKTYDIVSFKVSNSLVAVGNWGVTTPSCLGLWHLSLVMRKPAFCICENKDADQLRGNREADQRLCFRYTDSTIHLLPKSEISSL